MCKPGAKLGIDFGPVKQLQVPHLVADPLVRLRESQRATALRVLTECAVEWDETIADEAVREQILARSHRGCDCVTVDALW